MRQRQKLIILGTRTFAEELADLVSDCDEFELAAFGENWERERCVKPLLDRPVIWVDDLAPLAGSHLAVCAVYTTRRSLFVEQVKALGFRFATIVHPTARVSRTAGIGAGCIVSAGSIIGAHTRLGDHVIVNRGCLIGHHLTVNDYVTISPGANLGGLSHIGRGTYIGIGAVVLDKLRIGHDAVVGAGSVVTKDVPDQVQVIGVPARVTKTNVEGL